MPIAYLHAALEVVNDLAQERLLQVLSLHRAYRACKHTQGSNALLEALRRALKIRYMRSCLLPAACTLRARTFCSVPVAHKQLTKTPKLSSFRTYARASMFVMLCGLLLGV